MLLLPLVAGGKVTGLVGVSAPRPVWTSEQLAQAERVVGDSAVRLESALLFDDIRRLATTEERHRLAREVHDGIAQDLVFLGYGLDNILGLLEPADPAADEVRALRGQVTRVVRDLRMSLYDLRSELGAYGGLGEALGEQVRQAGRQGGLRVHLELAEAGARLLPDTEAQLLRIAQEAIANARKRSRAENLWVTYEVDPPEATLRIRDDGRGLASSGSGYGRTIMAERAARIGARLSVAPAAGGGTEVLVRLGAAVGSAQRSGTGKECDVVPGAAG